MSSYKNDKPWVNDEYLMQCDICGVKRYSYEMKKRWDGFWCCIPGNCWDPKDPIYWIPPVVMDPHTIVDVRPQTTTLAPSPFNITWNNPVNPLWPTNNTWNTSDLVWNSSSFNPFDPAGNENQ